MKAYLLALTGSYVGLTTAFLTLLHSSSSIKNPPLPPLPTLLLSLHYHPLFRSACVWCDSLLSKQAGSPSSLGRRCLSEEVCVSFSLIVSCCSTEIFGGCVFHFKLKSSFYKYIQFPLILTSVREKLDQNEIVNRIKSGKWEFNLEVFVVF